MADGLFVAVEGIDRSGKTTLTAQLATRFASCGHTAVSRKEPSTGAVGRLFRTMSATGDLTPVTAALLSAADRQEQQASLRQDLSTTDVVVSDRYFLSGLAYHLADGVATDFYRSLNIGVRQADLYLYLDVPLHIAQRRRNRHHGRWEQPGFAVRVPPAYEQCLYELQRIEQAHVVRLDASQPADDVAGEAFAAIVAALNERQSV